MAFAETVVDREVLSGTCPVRVKLAERVYAGACLAASSPNWILSAHASGETPLLVAGTAGEVNDYIKAYPLAAIKVTTTLANVATLGELVSLDDDGTFVADTANYPDVGFVTEVGSDSLSAELVVCPMIQQLDTART